MTDYAAVVSDYLAVWNETDADVRAALIAKVFADNVGYTDPMADVSGAEQLAAVVSAVQQQFAGWVFRPAGRVDGHHDQVRFGWELGPEDAAAPIAGFDVAVLGEDGRITRVLGFLDRVPV